MFSRPPDFLAEVLDFLLVGNALPLASIRISLTFLLYGGGFRQPCTSLRIHEHAAPGGTIRPGVSGLHAVGVRGAERHPVALLARERTVRLHAEVAIDVVVIVFADSFLNRGLLCWAARHHIAIVVAYREFGVSLHVRRLFDGPTVRKVGQFGGAAFLGCRRHGESCERILAEVSAALTGLVGRRAIGAPLVVDLGDDPFFAGLGPEVRRDFHPDPGVLGGQRLLAPSDGRLE